MFFKKFQEFNKKLSSSNLSGKEKVLATISLAWIIIIGYLTWWNGLNNLTGDKSFNWDEWIWFGVVPAIVPYLFYFIWKKEEENKE
tara:strand:+ start:213 stop:470 length:258 start_codon:yes stop_codon:yes gene_type:complete